MPISWNTVIFKFRLIFATDDRRIVKGKAFHTVFVEAHWSVFLLLPRINGLPQNTLWKPCSDTILRSSVAKIKQNLKMTVFQEVGIDSKLLDQIYWSWYHSLLRKMLYLMMSKHMTFLARKVLKIHRSAFFGTPGIE